MDIWLINHYAVPPKYYPLARQANFAKYMLRQGHKVTIFAASTVHNSDLNLITDSAPYREEIVDGVKYVYIRCADYQGNGIKRIYNICEFAWKLFGVCKKFPKPDAIVATSMPPTSCAAGIWIARKYGCKGVAEIADLWPETLVAYGIAGPKNPAVVMLRWMEKWIYKKADSVVFTMEGAYEYILAQKWEKDVPREKVHFINNGVDIELFQYNRENYRVDDEDLENPNLIKIGYAGSIRKVNKVGMLLDIAKTITDPKVRFLIWGSGDEEAILRQRVIDEKITNVVFKGRVEKSYVPYITSKMDINYVDPFEEKIARYGISPNKLFDYFAAGKPILMGFTGRYNPAEPFGCTVCCEPNAVALREGLEKMLDMPMDAYKKMCDGAKAASEKYSFKNLTEMLLSVIEK